jgi:hypothetical protein
MPLICRPDENPALPGQDGAPPPRLPLHLIPAKTACTPRRGGGSGFPMKLAGEVASPASVTARDAEN